MSIKFRWLGTACYEIILPSGKVLMVDPYIDYSPNSPIKCDEVTGADYIAITHGHHDHCTDVGNLMRRFDSKVILNHSLADSMPAFFDMDPNRFVRVSTGDVIEFDDLRVEVLKSEHVSQVPAWRATYRRLTGERADPHMPLTELRETISKLAPRRKPDPKLAEMMEKMREAGVGFGEQFNFVFQTSDNIRIYIYCAGIEEYLRRQVEESRANIIFMQLAGVNAGKAAEYSALSGAGVVIPTHHDIEGLERGHERAGEMAEHLAARTSARFIDTVPGKWYEIGLTVNED